MGGGDMRQADFENNSQNQFSLEFTPDSLSIY